MAFVGSFNDFSDISDAFGSDYSAQTSFDPFSSESDVDPTGLESDLDALAEDDPSQRDSDADEIFEDLDTEDIEVGEDINEEDTINEVDLDWDDIIEPDFNPDDDEPINQDSTDISHEDGDEVEIDDNTGDQWEEVSPYEEISQDDDIIQDDSISQDEEVGFQEPLFYPDENDYDQDPTDQAEEEIYYVDHRDDLTDNIVDEIDIEGQSMAEASSWVASLEDFTDFTEQDVSSFHDPQEGFEITDGYDPPYPDFMADAMIELSNIVDDVFANIFDDPVNEPFSWFDSFA